MACTGPSPNWTSSWADLQSCHDSGSIVSGDTITISPGSHTATAQVNISKYIKIVGTGVDLLDNTDGDTDDMIQFTESTAGSIQFSGFNITQGAVNTHASGGSQTGVFKWSYTSGGKPILVNGNSYHYIYAGGNLNQVRTNRGVFWDNDIYGTVVGADNCASSGSALRHKITGFGIDNWKTQPTFGADDTDGLNNFYFEGNRLYVIAETPDIDDNGRCVYRFNLMSNSGGGTHGVDTSGKIGCRYIEYYENRFVRDYTTYNCDGDPNGIVNLDSFMVWRGGSGFCHSNVIDDIGDGYWGAKSEIKLFYENLWRNAGGYPCWDNIACPACGYPAPHIPGWGYSSGGTNPGGYGPGDSIPGTSSVGADVLQDIEPIYFFNNTGASPDYLSVPVYPYAGGDECTGGPDVADYIQADREFYNQVDSGFDGSTGCGAGERASRPSAGSSTNGVGYWSTNFGGPWKKKNYDGTTNNDSNNGCLDVMVSGAWVDCFYTPYVYPHELAGGIPLEPEPTPSVPSPHRAPKIKRRRGRG